MFNIYTVPSHESDLNLFSKMLKTNCSIEEITSVVHRIACRSSRSTSLPEIISFPKHFQDLAFFQKHHSTLFMGTEPKFKKFLSLFTIAILALMSNGVEANSNAVVVTDTSTDVPFVVAPSIPIPSIPSQQNLLHPSSVPAVSKANQIEKSFSFRYGRWEASLLTKAIWRKDLEKVIQLLEESGKNIDIHKKDNFDKSGFDYLLEITLGRKGRFSDSRKNGYIICNKILQTGINLTPLEYKDIYDNIMKNFVKNRYGEYIRINQMEDRRLGFKILNKILDKLPNNEIVNGNEEAFSLMINDEKSETIMQDSELSKEFYQKIIKNIDIEKNIENVIVKNRFSAFKIMEASLHSPDKVPREYGGQPNENKWTYLHIAVQSAAQNTEGGYAILKKMIEKSTPEMINKADVNGWTPFMLAVTKRNTGINQEYRLKIFDLFMEIKGLEVNAKETKDQKTALEFLTEETTNSKFLLTPEAEYMLSKLIKHKDIDLSIMRVYTDIYESTLKTPITVIERLNLHLHQMYTILSFEQLYVEMNHRPVLFDKQIFNYYEKINAVDKITKEIGMSKDYRTEFKNVLVEYDKWFYNTNYNQINEMWEASIFSSIGITTQQTIVADVLKVTKPIIDRTRKKLIEIYNKNVQIHNQNQRKNNVIHLLGLQALSSFFS